MLFFSRAVLAFVMGVSTRCVQKKKRELLGFLCATCKPFFVCVCVCVQARRPSSNRQQVRTFSHNSYKHDTFSFVFFRLSSFSLRWSTKERVTKQKDERRKRRGSGETPRVSFSSYWHEAQFFCLVFFFLPFVVLCMSRGNRQQSTLANKKKTVSPSVHCTYSSMNEEKKTERCCRPKAEEKTICLQAIRTLK